MYINITQCRHRHLKYQQLHIYTKYMYKYMNIFIKSKIENIHVPVSFKLIKKFEKTAFYSLDGYL